MTEIARRALVCAPLLPAYDREGGSRRLFAFIEFLCQDGWMVTFATRQARGGEHYVDLLQQRGVETYTSLDSAFELVVTKGQFDVAILVFWYLAEECLPKIRRLSPRTRVVVDSVDLHFLRNARRALHGSGAGLSPGTLDSTYASETVRELNAYAAADGVLAVSDKEGALIDDLAGGPNLAHVVPLTEELEPSVIPFTERRGILFVGNFNHPPNVQAAEHLLREIVPRIDPAILVEHPVYVVGNEMSEKLQHLKRVENVHMVGWVPSVLPYLHRARVTVVPLLHGAGTKHKVVQALMAGTPTVASPIGVEGLCVRNNEHILVADDPVTFAAHIARLVRDEDLWQRLSLAGRAHVRALHGQQAVHAQFDRALSAVLARQAKKLRLADLLAGARAAGDDAYPQLVRRIAETVHAELPPGARAAVISKGDDALLQLDGVSARHFPSTSDGVYAGYHPADSAAAIAHLEAQRAAGIEFLVVPRPSLWWLDYYAQFREHLERHYELVVSQDDTCLIFQLDPSISRKRVSI